MPAVFPEGTTAIRYPAAPRTETVDDYHGTSVADPFRTLEISGHPDTVKWAEEENALTASVLGRPEWEPIRERLSQLFNYERVSIPSRKGNRYFFSRNEGLQNQSVFYVQEGLDGAPRILIDPNRLSEDGTAALANLSVSDDGEHLAYGVSKGGSDWQEVHVRNIETAQDLSDRLEWVKFTKLSWSPDSRGFYYNRYPAPGTVPAGDEHYFPKVQYHLLGTPQSSDRVIYERPGDRDLSLDASISDDGRYVVVTASRGSADESEIWVDDLSDSVGFKPLFTGFRFAYVPEKIVDGVLYVLTNDGAARRRVIAIRLGEMEQSEVIPETDDYLSGIHIVSGKIVAHYLRNASSAIRIIDLDSSRECNLPLPGIGTVSGIEGTTRDPEMFLTFHSYIDAPANFRYDFRTNELTVLNRSGAPIESSLYETRQVWYPSRDGTKIPMFLSHRKGLKPNGHTPVFLYGYGGFNNPLTPGFNPVHFWFMEQGGIFAVANLRGGSEFGEEWHRGGILDRKQNVFDDFIAAGEWLIASGYTSREKLAISGRSNGGLLAAATLVQRPDLMQVAVVQVPVVDMLRYHLFTVARLWVPEYGSAENPEQFSFLYSYSPLHNVRDGTHYPATLVTTADTDDRVDPGPARKFAARLQQAQAGSKPILIRIEKKAGHSSGSIGTGGKPVSKLINEWADIWTFVSWQLGMS